MAATITIPMSVKPKLPKFYESEHWTKSIGKMSLQQRLQYRIDEVTRKLPSMSLTEKHEMWANEPYYEVAKIIIESTDYKYPDPKDKKQTI